jgi:hypothetical protein
MRHAVSLAALFSLVIPAVAVPLPRGGSAQLGPLSHKYLLDDADCVAVLNVRQILASTAYQKVFAGQVGTLLRDDSVAARLKEFGLDPLKDIDRIYFVTGRSSYPNNQTRPPGGVVVVEGRFDPARLQAGAKKLAKTTFEHGSARIYELNLAPGLSPFAAVLDKSHFVLAAQREQVQATLDKAAGKKKTALKSKALAQILATIKPEESLSVIGTGDTVFGGSYSSVKDGNGAERVTSKVITLAEGAGLQALTVVATIKDEVQVKVTMTATSADKAREVEKLLADGIQQVKAFTEKEFPQLAKALKGVKMVRKDATITIKGKGPGEAVRELFVGMFTMRAGGAPRPQPGAKRKP